MNVIYLKRKAQILWKINPSPYPPTQGRPLRCHTHRDTLSYRVRRMPRAISFMQ